MATNTNPFYTYSATAGSSKTLQKPQDGGDNNQWGNYINTDLDEIVAAVNALSDKIADASENTLVDFTATGSAVNHVGITNAATGNGPTISTAGTDSNVDLNVTPKGTGDSVFTNKIKVDDVIEKTTDHGVEIEGVLVKDSIVKTDDIQEKTTAHGVEIDGVTLKDGGGTFSGNVAVTGDLTVDTDTLKVDSTNEKVGINKTPATEFHAGGIIQLEDKVFAGGHTRTGSLVNINMGDDSTYASTSALLQIKNLGNRGAKGASNGSDLLRGDFSDANGFVFDKSGNLDITGSYNSGTIGNNVVFPAGTVLQVVQAQDSVAFAYSNTSEWNFGSASTRADDSHGGVADNLNVSLTTKKANSNFLVCVNLQNAGASAAGNVWGLNCYWSVDSYANPIVAGDPSTHGVYSNGEGLQSGFWVDAINDATWYPHYSQILKSSNTIAKDTSITFKTVISSYYSVTLYYNRQDTTNNGTYRLVPVSTLTIYEIAT